MTKFRFPINFDQLLVTENLSNHPSIVEDDDNQWSWLKTDGSKTILGWIEVKGKYLTLETNSVERGELGVKLVQSLLGDALGQPMGVHENLEDLRAVIPINQTFESGIENGPEIQALIQSHLTEHYRKTLDEPLPMFDNETPRACAGDSEKQGQVVSWLKHLESSGDKTPGPAYDFAWMWQELGLEKYRQ